MRLPEHCNCLGSTPCQSLDYSIGKDVHPSPKQLDIGVQEATSELCSKTLFQVSFDTSDMIQVSYDTRMAVSGQ